VIKRLFDIIASAIGLLLLAPVIAMRDAIDLMSDDMRARLQIPYFAQRLSEIVIN
jgi:lipopolysaccharide/colanic/teichoic acid biosynthesis glycosyltransferase